MKRTGLISLVISVFLCLQGYAQADSGRQPSGTNQPIADSSSLVPGRQDAMATPETAANTAIKQAQVKDTNAVVQSGYTLYWLIGCGLLGMMLGAFGYRLLGPSFRTDKKRGRSNQAAQNAGTPVGDQADDGGFVAQWKLEQEHAKLEALTKTLTVENDQLKRDKDELEQLLKTAKNESGMSAINPAKEIVFYMPQPNMNGRFQEASKRTDAADALYAFHVPRDNQRSATFEFIAKDAYLNAAIGNEPSWISIACDRTNQPSGTTTRVKTESPGQASLKDGEWEITRKAKITYL